MTDTKRVLVADDDRAMVQTLCDVLRMSGWETVSAGSGEEAIQQVDASAFTAVLMDVRMGGMSGVEAMRAIRTRCPAMPVILMTAYAFLQETPHPSHDEVREAIAGNLCRCTGYAPIIQAIVHASGAALPPEG